MKALITGASSGIGRDMAEILADKGYDLILVARSSERLAEVAERINTGVRIINLDLSKEEACFQLYDMTKNEEIDLLINNAGFGLFGEFSSTDLKEELNMIDVNIKAVHILTKLFLKDFIDRNSGKILNVASSAGFSPGPLLSAYYGTKAYVLRLTEAIYEELRRKQRNVYIGALCPGPVDTGFNDRANVKFSLKGLDSHFVASYALKQMDKGKLIIIPGRTIKVARIAQKLMPDKLLLRITYKIQRKKGE